MKDQIHHNHNKNDKEKLKIKDEEIQEIKQLDEELRPLNLVNSQISNIKGVKGIYIKECYDASNLFSWKSEEVFELYAGDENGQALNLNSKPILYAIARSQSSCKSCTIQGVSEVIITSKLDSSQSTEPYIYIRKIDSCCSESSHEIFINNKGNQNKIADVKKNFWSGYTAESDYVKQLQITSSICRFNCMTKNYQVSDADGNSGIFIQKLNCCCNQLVHYNLGFPPKYNDDQKTILLAICVYKAFTSYKKRSNKS